MNNSKKDINLKEAVRRHEQKLPPMPADLNDRVMRRVPLLTSPKGVERERRRLWSWVGAVAASIVLLLVFRFTQKPEEGETISRQQLYAKLYPSQQERKWREDSSPSFEETVAEIEQSGKQLQLAIAEIQQ